MNDKQLVKAALKRSGESQASLSAKLGYANKTSIATMLSRPSDLRMSVLFKMLDALGFEIVVRPKNKNDKSEWLVSEDDEPIETERYVSPEEQSEISRIKSENAAAMREGMKK